MPKILVTGKNGTLGNEFMQLYGPDSVGVDYAELDITDEAAVAAKIAELKPTVIINCAAYNAVDKAEQEPDVADKVNGYAVGYLAKAAKSVGAIMVHYSTNYVFAGTEEQGYTEQAPPSPQSAYARSKLLGETELQANTGQFYLIRTAWLYGKPGMAQTGKLNYVERILQLSTEKDELEGVADQYGQPTWSRDLALATQKLIDGQSPFGTYHLTNSGKASWHTWAEEILKLKGINIPLRKNTMANFDKSGHIASRPQFGLLINTKTEPLRSWQEALKDYLQTL